MASNSYNFFQTESGDGIDYFFLTNSNRIYTVSFDMSIYASNADYFPTLVQYGYGILFKFDPIIPRECGVNYKDESTSLTIIDIIKDFLETAGENIFIVYECPKHKQNQIFSKWVGKDSYPEILRYGFEVQLKGFEDGFFGFITKIDNPHVNDAKSELLTFFASL